MEWSELLNQLEGQTKQKLLALDKLGVGARVLSQQPELQDEQSSEILISLLPLAFICLQAHVQSNVVYKEQVSALLDMSGQLLADNNFKVRRRLPIQPRHLDPVQCKLMNS